MVKALYYKGNEIRGNPAGLKTNNADSDKYLASQTKQSPLIWSPGLSRACRDLVIENGPFGIEGSVASMSGD